MPEAIRQYPSTPDELPRVLFEKAYADSPPEPEPDSATDRCIVRKSSNSVKNKGVIMLNSEGKPTDPAVPMHPMHVQMQQMYMQQQMMMRLMMQQMQGGQAGDMTGNPGNVGDMPNMPNNPGNAMSGMFRMQMPPMNIGGMSQNSAGSSTPMSFMDGGMFGTMPSNNTGGSNADASLHSLKPKGRRALMPPQSTDASGTDASGNDVGQKHDEPEAAGQKHDEPKADGGDLPEGAPAAPAADHLQAMKAALNAAQPVQTKGKAKAKAKAKGKANAKAKSKSKASAKGKATTKATDTSTPADKVSKMTHGWSSIIVTRASGQRDQYFKHDDSKRLRSKAEVAEFCKANKVKSPF